MTGEPMTDAAFRERAETILWNMALERIGFWRQLWRRWEISDEPLRNDAANLIRQSGHLRKMRADTRLVGDNRHD